MTRFDPTLNTIKRLFALSGNRCAYPFCDTQLVGESDIVMADICHIEAAEPGGSRFNPLQSDEDRRSFNNLILLCPNHHRVIDNPRVTVAELQRMKDAHNEKFKSNPYVPPDIVIRESYRRFTERREFRAAYVAAFSLLRCTYPNSRIHVIGHGLYQYTVAFPGSREFAVLVEPIDVNDVFSDVSHDFAEQTQPYYQDPISAFHFEEKFESWAYSHCTSQELHLLILLHEFLVSPETRHGINSSLYRASQCIKAAVRVVSRAGKRVPPMQVVCGIFNHEGYAMPIKGDLLDRILHLAGIDYPLVACPFGLSAHEAFKQSYDRFLHERRRN